MVQLTAYTKVLALASLCLLLPQCISEKLNAFDMRVFSSSMKDINEKVNKMESMLTATNKELVERFERTQSQVEGELESTNEGLKQLENSVLTIVSALQSSVSAAREDLNTNKRQWEEVLASMSSIQTSLSTTRDELSINQRNWHDGLTKMSFIESSVNATRNGMDENKKDLANVLASISALETSVHAARDELNVNKRDWDTSLALIHSLQSTLSATRDDLATNKKDWIDAIASVSSMRSSISAAQEELTSTKKEWSHVSGRLPSIESSLSATRTEVAKIMDTLNTDNPCAFTGSTEMRSTIGLQRDIAFGKPSYGSPHWLNNHIYPPSKAVDNDINSMYHSDHLWNPWWFVDFGFESSIKEIFIQPRFEAVVERFHDVEIRLGNDLVRNGDFSSYKLLFFYRGPYTVGEGVLKCSFNKDIQGRYLSIQIMNKKEYLQLNTVKVFA